MSEGGDAPNDALSRERTEALRSAIAGSLGATKEMFERQMATTLVMSAILAAMPQTAAVDLKKVGTAIQLLAAKQSDPEKLRDEMNRLASFIINLSRRLRELDTPPSASETPTEDFWTDDERA